MLLVGVFLNLLASVSSLTTLASIGKRAAPEAEDFTCPLQHGFIPVPGPDIPASLADDEVLVSALDKDGLPQGQIIDETQEASPLQPLGKTSKGSNNLPSDAMATYIEALKSYKQKKQEFQIASAKLSQANEGLLEVRPADAAFLSQATSGKLKKSTLVAFYAPWCPHCQRFVLHDMKGNPRNAPLEVLRRDFKKANATKDVIVARADVTRLGQKGVPKSFVVHGIPTVYFVSEEGKPTPFKGNPHNIENLKKFVTGLL